MLTGLMYALLAGLFGAVASSSAKLSLGASYLKELCDSAWRKWTVEKEGLTLSMDSTACEWVHLPLRLGCGLLLVGSNAVMWTFFAKALHHTSSSARATVTTTASNFISSALLGHVIFGETHALLWWIGITLTLLGLFILNGSSLKDQEIHVKKKD